MKASLKYYILDLLGLSLSNIMFWFQVFDEHVSARTVQENENSGRGKYFIN